MSASTTSSSKRNSILILGGSGRVGKQVITTALSKGHQVTALVRNLNSLPSSLTTIHPNLHLHVGSPLSSTDIVAALTEISSSLSGNSKITIISTLGQTRSNPSNPWSQPTSPALYMSQSAQAVIDALRSLHPRRSSISRTYIPAENALLDSNHTPGIEVDKFIVLSMFGTAETWKYMHWSLRLVMQYSNMRVTIEDHDAVVKILRENLGGKVAMDRIVGRDGKLPVKFVAVRPVMLDFAGTDSNGSETVTAAVMSNVEREEGQEQQGRQFKEIKEYGDGQKGMGMLLKCDVRSLSKFMVDRVEDTRYDGEMPVIST